MMLVNVDAAGLEWRLAVELSKDPVGIKEINNGDDTHELNRVAFELPTRRIAKFFLFRVIFRGTGYGFANDPDFSHVSTSSDFWDDVIDKFYKKYHGLDQTHQQWVEDCERFGHVQVFTGRRWPFKKNIYQNWRGQMVEKWDLKQITNKPIQGTGNDLMAIVRVNIKKRLTQERIHGKMILTVHDSIVVDSKDPQAVGQIMLEEFDRIPSEVERLFGYQMSIPFPGEVKVGKNLLEMESLK